MKRLFQLMTISFAIATFSHQAAAQQQDGNSQRSPLVRLLQAKGIITEQEAAMIGEASSPGQAERRLADLLLAKGMISRQEYDQTIAALGASPPSSDSAAARVITAAAHPSGATTVVSVRGASNTEATPAAAQTEGPMTTMSKMPVKVYGDQRTGARHQFVGWLD